jgi:hypothetical protein
MYNREVAKALVGMGVDPMLKEKKEREDRPRVSPKVAALLEGMGIKYAPQDIQGNTVNEAGTSPLDMPGDAPMVDPNGQGGKNKPQNSAPGQVTGQKQGNKPAKPAQVQLKRPATQMKTLQDVTDKMTEVTANIKTVDLLIQALNDNKSSDNQIETHKLTLQGPIQAVVNAVQDLKKLVE